MFGPQHYFDFQPFFGKRKFYEMLAGVTRFVEFTHDAHFTPMHTNIFAHKLFHSIKGGFFSESVICFSKFQKKYIPNYYPEFEI